MPTAFQAMAVALCIHYRVYQIESAANSEDEPTKLQGSPIENHSLLLVVVLSATTAALYDSVEL